MPFPARAVGVSCDRLIRFSRYSPHAQIMLRNTIEHGDCIQGMRQLPAGSVDLAFADPPFNIGFSYDVYADELPAAKYLAWSRDWMAAVHQALKPSGAFWLAIGDEYAAELKIAAQQIGFHCRSWVIWYYTFGVNCKFKFTRSHAHLFHFVKDPENFVFRAKEPENRIPSARQLVYNDARANPKGRLPDDTWIIRPEDAAGDFQPRDEQLFVPPPSDLQQTWTLRPQDLAGCFQESEDTWYFPRVAGTFKERAGFHGCQMPEQLLGRIIRACSEPGDLVLDPFSGSGTTVAVAKKLGRDYLAFDLSPEYVKQGRARIQQVRSGDLLDGSAEPLVSAPPTAEPKSKSSVTNTSKPQTADDRFLQAVMQGVKGAFGRTFAGHSADRVVADPDLNAAFIAACQQAGLAGDARSWNMLLFRLRKAGQLADLETRERTSLSWEECDPFLYASELAWQQLLEEELAESLDEILCDPVLARRFDEIAQSFAPGHSSLRYRWGALKLRKQGSVARRRAQALLPPSKYGRPAKLREQNWETLPTGAGVYLVGAPKRRKLYVGESLNLRERLKAQFSQDRPQLWEGMAEQHGFVGEELCLWVREIDSNPGDALAWQACLVNQFQPVLNLRLGEDAAKNRH